jgi:uncharacterized protein YndB with AHSA1/START domain
MADHSLTVRVTRLFDATADRVFDAWLDPATAGSWLYATPTGRMVKVEIDGRVGGTFCLVDCRDGEDVAHVGEYLELARPSRIVFVFGVPKYSPARDRVAIDIAPRPDGCELVLVHTLTPGMEEWAPKVEEGWRGILDGLASSLRSPA